MVERYISMSNLMILYRSIDSILVFDGIFPLLTVEECDFLVGGNHRLYIVCTVLQMLMLSYKFADLSDFTDEPISVAFHDRLIVFIVEATESCPVPYSVV